VEEEEEEDALFQDELTVGRKKRRGKSQKRDLESAAARRRVSLSPPSRLDTLYTSLYAIYNISSPADDVSSRNICPSKKDFSSSSSYPIPVEK
jgi:hypothetical protein